MKMKTVYELTNELMTIAIEKKMENWIPNIPFMLFVEFGKRFNNKGAFSGFVLTGERTDRVSLGVDYRLSDRTISGHVDIQSVKTKSGLQRGYKGIVAMEGYEYPLGTFTSLSDLVEKAVGRMSIDGGSAFDALDYFKEIIEDHAKSIDFECFVEYVSIIGDADRIHARYDILRGDRVILKGRVSFTRRDGLWVCCIEFDGDDDYIAVGKDKNLKVAIKAACTDKRKKRE